MYKGIYRNKEFSLLLKELLHKYKFKQSDLAKLKGVTCSAVSRWVTGRNLPDLDTLFIIVKYVRLKGKERKKLFVEFLAVKKSIKLNLSTLTVEEGEKVLKRYKYKKVDFVERGCNKLFLVGGRVKQIVKRKGFDTIAILLDSKGDFIIDVSYLSLKRQMEIINGFIKVYNTPFSTEDKFIFKGV